MKWDPIVTRVPSSAPDAIHPNRQLVVKEPSSAYALGAARGETLQPSPRDQWTPAGRPYASAQVTQQCEAEEGRMGSGKLVAGVS